MIYEVNSSHYLGFLRSKTTPHGTTSTSANVKRKKPDAIKTFVEPNSA